MLPSNPRAGGLPSGPRSRSVGPSRQQNARRSEERYGDIPAPSSSKHVRQQKSIASFPREPTRSRPPPSQPSPPPSSDSGRNWQRRHTPHTQSISSAPDISRSRTSQESSASSVSSLFDRVRNGAASYTSSLTSLEDNGNDIEERRGRSSRKQRVYSPESSLQEDYETERTDTGTGDGYTVWSRVAAAASTLTISVSKAWASNIATYAGEETPVGQESRLTRAMKAYHIEIARDPTDLPEWLFEEHERQPRRTGRTGRPEVNAEEVELPTANVSRARRAFPETRMERPVIQSTDDMVPSGRAPKGTDRLKALREARRPQADTAFSPRAPTREQAASTYEEPRQRAPKVGLPSGPGPASRARRR